MEFCVHKHHIMTHEGNCEPNIRCTCTDVSYITNAIQVNHHLSGVRGPELPAHKYT